MIREICCDCGEYTDPDRFNNPLYRGTPIGWWSCWECRCNGVYTIATGQGLTGSEIPLGWKLLKGEGIPYLVCNKHISSEWKDMRFCFHSMTRRVH